MARPKKLKREEKITVQKKGKAVEPRSDIVHYKGIKKPAPSDLGLVVRMGEEVSEIKWGDTGRHQFVSNEALAKLSPAKQVELCGLDIPPFLRREVGKKPEAPKNGVALAPTPVTDDSETFRKRHPLSDKDKAAIEELKLKEEMRGRSKAGKRAEAEVLTRDFKGEVKKVPAGKRKEETPVKEEGATPAAKPKRAKVTDEELKKRPFILGKKINRQPGASRTARWNAAIEYLKTHKDATIGDLIDNTPYTAGDFKMDLDRGALK